MRGHGTSIVPIPHYSERGIMMLNVNTSRRILLVEDDFDISEMLETFFRSQGFEISTSHWGEDGVKAATETMPDLIILDIRLPDIDGFEVARQLRGNRKTSVIPILFLTERRDRSDLLKGLELGADDYVTKPFDIQELKLRVKNIINRYHPQVQTNQTTGLPDGAIIREQVEKMIGGDVRLMVFAIKNLNAFRDQFGFVSASDVIKNTSSLIKSQLRDGKIEQYFLGHLRDDSFILALEEGDANSLFDRLGQKLNMAMELFYPASFSKNEFAPEEKLLVVAKFYTTEDLKKYNTDQLLTDLNSL